MLATIKKQFKLDFAEWVGVLAAVLLGAALFGQVLMALIAHFDGDIKRYAPVGTIMAILMMGIYVGIMFMANIRLQFHIQVSFGCTRRRFFVSYYIFVFAVALTGWLLLLALAYVENALNPVLYPNLGGELNLVPYLWKWGIPVAAAVPIIGGFCGVLIMQFGRIAAGILWVLWMVLCLGIPNLDDAAENAGNSLFGQICGGILQMVAGVSGTTWVMLAAGICIVCLAISYIMIRKMEVKA